ncbi:CD1247 N-terminal domain-containing protein [Fusibacter sp. JL298sf-3]
MSYMHERVAYLKGLADGMELDQDSKKGKLLLEIIDVLEEFAEEIEDVYEELDDLTEAVDELDEYVDAIDEDLSDLEAFIDEDLDALEALGEDYEAIDCPECDETVYIESQIVDKCGEIECPSCGVIIDFFDDCDCCADDDCGCGCGCDEDEDKEEA